MIVGDEESQDHTPLQPSDSLTYTIGSSAICLPAMPALPCPLFKSIKIQYCFSRFIFRSGAYRDITFAETTSIMGEAQGIAVHG